MDPKQIVRRGDAYDMWINDDWSDVSDTKKSGLRQVKAIDVVYADGSRSSMVLDERGQPISSVRELPPDETQQRAWKDQQAQANRPPEERNNNGRRERWNPQTQRWDDVGSAINSTAPANTSTDWRTEGTPDGQGGFDNSRPIMVRTVNGQRETRALTSAELKDWNEAGQRSRNPGGKTDKDIEDERRANEPKPRQTRVNPADPTKVQEFDPTANGGTGAWVDAGTNAAGVQAQQATKKSEPVQGKDGKQYNKVTETDPKTGQTRTYYTDASGKEVPLPGDKQIQNAPPFTPDWQKPGLGIIEYASTVRARPDLTDEQKTKLIQEAHTLATATVSQGNAVLSAQQTEASRATSERGQDAGMANQRLSTSSSNFATAARQAADDTKYSLGSEAASVLPYYLALAQASGQAYGGFNTPPPVRTGAAIGQIQRQGIPGLGTLMPGSFKPGAPAGAPVAAAGATPPNALGLGAGVGAPAPSGPAMAAAEAARQQGMATAGPPPTAGEPGGPPLAAGPVAPTPSPGYNPGTAQEAANAGLPPGVMAPPPSSSDIFNPGPHPAPGSINSPQPPTQYPYNVPDAPNFDPSLPRGYAPVAPGMLMMRASTTPEMEAPGDGRKPRWRGEGAPGAGTVQPYPLVAPDMTGRGAETDQTVEPSGGRIIYEPMFPPGNQPAPAEMPSSSTPVFSPWHTTAPNGTYYDQTPVQTYDYQPSTTDHNPNVAPWHTPGAPGGVNIETPVPNAQRPSGGQMAALFGNVGPWAAQPQHPQAPSGQGALLMQRAAGGYNPASLNAQLLAAGLDPDVINMMGGVG